MTKTQRRKHAQEARFRPKKTGLKCEECDGEIIRSVNVYICEKCGLTQDREYIAQVKSQEKSEKKKK